MPTLTVSPEGQITLGNEVLPDLGLNAGDRVEYEVVAENMIRLKPIETSALKRTVRVSDLFGILKRENQRTVTIEEMNETIADGWAGIERQR